MLPVYVPWSLGCEQADLVLYANTCWEQVLPLVPPEEEFWSPYTGLDALCGSTLVISLDKLIEAGLLAPEDLPPLVAEGTADFFAVSQQHHRHCQTRLG